ncbi:putative reverse transcriptase domain-containing protein [Tanacetum coccineum]
MSASMEARIAEHTATPILPTSPAYDQAPLVESSAAARPPRGQYDFVDTVKVGQGLIHSLGHNARTIARAADRAEDVGYFRALHASKHRMMTSIEEVNLRTDRRDIRLKIDIVRGQRTAYETELHEVRKAYLSFEAQNRALLALLETLETHMSRMEWQRQRAEDDAVRQMMRIHVLKARAQIDTVEDTDSSCAALTWWNGHVRTLGHDAAYAMTWGTLKKKLTDKYYPKGEIKKLEIELWNLRVRGNDVATYTQCFQELALMCTKFLADETKKVDKNYAVERQNDNKRKDDDSSRNNQQPHKKKNVARAYTAGPGEKKAYTGNLPLCTKCNYHHTGQCAPKYGNCKRYGHATNDYRVNTNNNNNKNQKAGACYECGNTGHIKKNCPKLKNHGNDNRNGTTQGRAYAFEGRDASPDSNVITGTFLLNNRYATILFDTGVDRSFVSNTFSALINIIPTTLESHYDVELSDGKIIGGACSFWKRDVNFSRQWKQPKKEESRLNIISCTKAQMYLSKGCDVFLAHITTKEAKDKSEGKQLEDVSIVRDFPEVFLEDLPSIPLARQVEFQIDLVLGDAPVARAPYRLAPS